MSRARKTFGKSRALHFASWTTGHLYLANLFCKLEVSSRYGHKSVRKSSLFKTFRMVNMDTKILSYSMYFFFYSNAVRWKIYLKKARETVILCEVLSCTWEFFKLLDIHSVDSARAWHCDFERNWKLDSPLSPEARISTRRN